LTESQFQSWVNLSDRPPLVMGVLNVTPDSFSDGGKFASSEAAIEHARAMARDGAAILDIGGESTRPGSQAVEADEQIRRILPVIKAIAGRVDVMLSVDTTRAAVAEAALDAGCYLVNDISGGRDDEGMLPLVARRKAPIVLMHMQGTPATMQKAPVYTDVAGEVASFLRERVAAARALGIEAERILIDPGIGFGKTMGHNLELIRRLGELKAVGRPIVAGVSRKGFIGTITGEEVPANRLFGTAASVAWCIMQGASIVRVHDVRPMVQVVQMIRAIREGWPLKVGPGPSGN